MFGGFRYADRLIRSTEDLRPGFPSAGVTAEQTNHTRAGVAGVNWLPLKNVRLHVEGEIGRNDNPFTPVSLRDYHAIRSEAAVRAKTLTFGAGYQENYTITQLKVTAYSSHARTYSGEVSWNAKSWVSVDASYRSCISIPSAALISSPAPRALEIAAHSPIYISNIHAGNLGLRFAITKRADLYVGYNIRRTPATAAQRSPSRLLLPPGVLQRADLPADLPDSVTQGLRTPE